MTPESHIRQEADRCVMCGLCLPYCPTFRLTGNEAESPRGRIALMAALAGGQLAPDASALMHLDRCIGCRACESMCPSGVRYGTLLRASRALAPRRAGATLPSGGLRRRALEGYPGSGLQRFVRATGVLGKGRLARAEALLPSHHEEPEATEPASSSDAPGRVVLFTGCTGSLLEPETVRSAVRLLAAVCYGTRVATDLCCGALELNAGQTKAASAKATACIKALADADAVVGIASGCTAALSEYPEWVQTAGADALVSRVADAVSFLAERWSGDIPLRPLPEKVAVHVPCTARNVLKQESAVFRLLNYIPDIDLVPLPDNHICCGAGGDYMLRQPEMADRLRDAKTEAVSRLNPRWLVSSNIGCALHMAAGLRAAGSPVEVIHPLALLARCLHAEEKDNA